MENQPNEAGVETPAFRIAGRDGGKHVVEFGDGERKLLGDQELNALYHREKSPDERVEELSGACENIAALIESSKDLPQDAVGAAVAPLVEALIGLDILGADDKSPAKPKANPAKPAAPAK